MKTTIFSVLVFILLFSLILSGCGSGSTTPAATTTKPAATTPAQTTPVGATTTAPTSSPSPAFDYPIPFNPDAQKGGTMIFNHNAVISFISAPADGPNLTQRVARFVFEPLLICDVKENLKPWLATSWDVSPDGKAVTLKLRQGVKFHDGTDFNAEAVKFNLELDLKNNINGSAVLKKVVSYDIPDPYTIVINLSAPDSTLLNYFAQGIIGLMASPTAQQKPTTPENITEVHMVGTGPFMYDSWQRDNYVQFKKNPNYWQPGKPYLDGFRWNFIPDFTASLLAFKSGQANAVLTLDPIDAIGLKNEGYSVSISPLAMLHWLTTDASNPESPFAKLEVRQALEYALNKDEIAAIGRGYFFPTTQFAQPEDGYYDSSIVPRNYNPAKAKELLTAAGYPNGIDVIVITNQSIRVDTQNVILAQLKAGGFNVTKVDVQTSAAYTTTTQKGWRSTTPGVGSILMPGFPTADNLTGLMARFNTNLFPDQLWPDGFREGWVDVLSIIDKTERDAAIKALIRQAFDTALIIPYQYDSSRWVTDNKVQGWTEYYYANNSPDFFQPAELWLKTK
jgi:ABC-type transport system substrate-binding protein